MWKQITLVGVGLLNGSIGLAARRHGLAGRIMGLVRREASVAECRRLGVVDEATLDDATALRGADFIILGTPVRQMRELAHRLAPHVRRGAVITDVGSVKGRLVSDLEEVFRARRAHFIGSHPMAGGEQMGPAAARADLFQSAKCVLTPTARSSRTALGRVRQFWEALGCQVLLLPPDTHDQLVSRASHLPHVTAAALARLVLAPGAPAQQAALCATGFRDTTRVASGSPEMWRDIALENHAALGAALEEFMRELRIFQRLLRRQDAEGLQEYFAEAKRRRDQWLAAVPVSPSPE
ncbi:prephenate dehydrogenase/arogenate dehydrogenase family protein [Fontisphaera persica]|uniref:prephenate dehydrogenase n=1 Tax=Fontisphaera persica TaxID=2974023 RepID=UPI0024BF261E|nr:prephenate dehydrogenase/arogenate dehydrogenase family protein [Fontisphaera persica]WCJ61251.1 prephenate dehydrogenase/arogenate dehydrogenase family protein [Fontisphaera persica]